MVKKNEKALKVTIKEDDESSEEEKKIPDSLHELVKNKYQIIEMIAGGGYGCVYKAMNVLTGDTVAIKTFNHTSNEYYAFYPSILRESSTLVHLGRMQQLKQQDQEEPYKSHIISIQEILYTNDFQDIVIIYPFMAQDLFSIQDNAPDGMELLLSLQDVQSISYQILLAIYECHRYQIVHRDIKPENILLDQKVKWMNNKNNHHQRETNIKDIHLYLCDFGHSRVLNPLPRAIYTNEVATLMYRSPELLLQYDEYGLGIDMWSFGCILIELVTGDTLFQGNNDQHVWKSIATCFNIKSSSNNTSVEYLSHWVSKPILDINTLQQDPIYTLHALETILTKAGCDMHHKKINPLLDLLGGLLSINPKTRTTVIKALQHPFYR